MSFCRRCGERDREENTLQSQIHALRKALGSERGAVQTVPGRGYRFVGISVNYGQRGSRCSACSSWSNTSFSALTNIPAEVSPIIGPTKTSPNSLKSMER